MATINVSRAARPRGLPSPATARRRAPLLRRVQRNTTGYLFLVGALLCFGLFSWYPMIREVVLSFQRVNLIGQSEGWAGFENYRHMFADPSFWSAWRVTGTFALMALVFGYAIPFVIAVGLNEMRHAQSYFRLLVYLPVMMPPVAAAFVWKWLYTPDNSGLFNALLHDLHLPTSQWLQSANPQIAVLCMVLFSTWANMGGGVLIYLASLQGIPGELYEAAELDGAGVLKRVWHVTIPQTRLILSLMLLLQIVATVQAFTESLVLTGGANNTGTVVYLVYQYATNFNNFGGAAALGVVLLVILGIFSGAYLWLNRRGSED
jgi:multiple sugar transport system permease protein